MNYIQFCKDYRVDWKDHGHKHCRHGWVQVECPFCYGNPGYHLGFCLTTQRFVCYRCGAHSATEVVATLARTSYSTARDIIKKYGGTLWTGPLPEHTVTHAEKVELPLGTGPLGERHKEYLLSRKFNPEELASVWGLQGTGIAGPYKFRVIAPIYYRGQLVSYQGRDITDRSPLKYKACREEDEVVHHKHILYGLDKVDSPTVVVVEGITDVWRLGPGAVATFGLGYTQKQLLLLSLFKRAVVVFDGGEEQAREKAERLSDELEVLGTKTISIDLESGDPAELGEREVREIRRFFM